MLLQKLKLYVELQPVRVRWSLVGAPIFTVLNNSDEVGQSASHITTLKITSARHLNVKKKEKLLAIWDEHQNQRNLPLSFVLTSTKVNVFICVNDK
jgi:hypothetical protein